MAEFEQALADFLGVAIEHSLQNARSNDAASAPEGTDKG